MSDLFPNYDIDLEKGTVYSNMMKRMIGSYDDGYHNTKIKDKYGNNYYKIHQVIIAEGLQLPKHLWPVDETGRRYIPDHILPVSNGGTDTFENLHLIPMPDNSRNPKTRENMSKAGKKRFEDPEEREKQSEIMKKRWEDPEEKRKCSERMKKRWEDPEERERYSEMFKGENNPNYGNKWSIEQRMNISEEKREQSRQLCLENNIKKRKAVIQRTLDGEFVTEWPSTREAGRNGYGQSNVAGACRGERNHEYKGFKWYYKDES